jgi:hypothetical protein
MTIASATVTQNDDYRPHAINLQAYVESDCEGEVCRQNVQQNDDYRPYSIDLDAVVFGSNGEVCTGTIPQNDDYRPYAINLEAIQFGCGSCEGTLVAGGGFQMPGGPYTINLGPGTGEVWFDFDAYSVPDKFCVVWDGNLVIETAFIGSASYDDEILKACGEKVGASSGVRYYFEKDEAGPPTAKMYNFSPISGTAWEVKNWCPGDEKGSSQGPPPVYGSTYEEETWDESSQTWVTQTFPAGPRVVLPPF